MCGIGLIVRSCGECCDRNHINDDSAPSSHRTSPHQSCAMCDCDIVEEQLQTALARRGPDLPLSRYDACSHPLTFKEQTTAITFNRREDNQHDQLQIRLTNSPHQLSLFASVLHLRGKHVVKQPMVTTTTTTHAQMAASANQNSNQYHHSYALCWNGECYAYRNNDPNFDSGGFDFSEHFDVEREKELSDTEVLLKLFLSVIHQSNASSTLDSISTSEHTALAQTLSNVCGEYAFIFHHQIKADHFNQSHVYFGRDPLGRRSLLMTNSKHQFHQTDTPFIVSSTSLPNSNNAIESTLFEEIVPGRIYKLDLFTGSLSYQIIHAPPSPLDQSSLFHQQVDQTQSIIPHNFFQDVPSSMMKAATLLHHHLEKAVRRRVINLPSPLSSDPLQFQTKQHNSQTQFTTASTAVLFSGGLDSVVLAALSHNHIPPNQPIDLLNVAFSSSSTDHPSSSTSPDRIAAILSHRELQSLYPQRKWNLLAIDIDYDQVLHHEHRICSLIHPCNTVMDFNIGSAFWFASRARGHLISLSQHDASSLHSNRCRNNQTTQITCSKMGCDKRASNECIFKACTVCCGRYQKPISRFLGKSARIICPKHSNATKKTKSKKKHTTNSGTLQESFNPESILTSPTPITSSAKILLCGIGADEQLGGYGRHRTTYQTHGYSQLKSELQMDTSRLWKRNLGRDDRCLSDHGKEARFPFLDETVVKFLEMLDITDICDMDRPQGEGDKMILRIVAKRIGVEVCSSLVKRAIQFGSRIAKVSDGYRFGTHRGVSGTTTFVSSSHKEAM